MPIDQPQLWARIEGFALDEPRAALSFTRRLAREHGWSLTFTRRAILEYRRFVYLAMTAGHPVCPSDAVDEVWHLHLTCTRSYWDHFCPEVLGRPLHHDPTRGGPAEHEKHLRMYEQTLESYRRTFDAPEPPPPPDIWPPPAERFRSRRWRRIDASDYWFIPRHGTFRSLKTAAIALAAIALAGCGPMLLAITNPLDWTGPEFLLLYISLAVVALVVAVRARRRLRSTSDEPPPSLDAYEAAMLDHGPRLAIAAALAALARRGAIIVRKLERGVWQSDAFELEVAGEAAGDVHPLERAVWNAIRQGARTPDELSAHVKREIQAIVAALRDKDLLLSRARRRMVWMIPAAIMAGVCLFGVAKIIVGVARDRPVEWLSTLCFATALAALFFASASRRTIQANRALIATRRERALLRPSVLSRDTAVTPAEVAMAVGLFGVGTLSVLGMDDLRLAVPDLAREMTRDASAGFATGCGGGSGGGCGGCGGGGN